MKTYALVPIVLTLLAFSSPAFGQPETPGTPKLKDSQKSVIVERLLRRIEDFYVLQDQATSIAAAIRDRYENRAYHDLDDVQQFGRQLTTDLRDVSQDAHFAVIYNPETFQAMEAELAELDGPNSREALKQWLEDDEAAPDIGSLGGEARQNFFFSRLEILEGNVGYLRLDRMPDLAPAKPTVDAAMAFLANSDAVILDLRDNPGGVGGFIPYLMSYFFSEGGTYLYKREFPAVGVTDEYFTEDSLPGRRLDDVPIYVLMSPHTGSAARNLSYTLQAFERAVLVGEASGVAGYGGAHSGGLFPLADGLLAIVPIGRVVNARTNTNWREGGVIPDVEVASADALGRAHTLALEALLKRNDDEVIAQELQQALQNLELQQSAEPGEDNSALAEYVGNYGTRSITLDQGTLKYARQGMGARLDMREIEADLFGLVLPAGAQSSMPPPNVRFNRDGAGAIVSFSLINPDGSEMETAKKNE